MVKSNLSARLLKQIEYLRGYYLFANKNLEYFENEEVEKITLTLANFGEWVTAEDYNINRSEIDATYRILHRIHVGTIRQLIMKYKRKYHVKQLDEMLKKQIERLIKEDYALLWFCDDKLLDLAFDLIWEYMSICCSVWEYMTFLTPQLTEKHYKKAKDIYQSDQDNTDPYVTKLLHNNEALHNLIEGNFISFEDIVSIEEVIITASKEFGFERSSLKKLIFLEETIGNTPRSSCYDKIDDLIANALAKVS